MNFNFILDNGDRSKQRDKGHTNHTSMIPWATKIIRSVKVFLPSCIDGFCYLITIKIRYKCDAVFADSFRMGYYTTLADRIYANSDFKTALIVENEVIVGVVLKLHFYYKYD